MARPSRETVGTIVEHSYHVEKRFPPVLVLSVKGELPTEGWSDAQLAPRAAPTRPIDGIWEFELSAIPPEQPATLHPSFVAATYRWEGFDDAIVLGFRVYGIGQGVKEIPLHGRGPSRS